MGSIPDWITAAVAVAALLAAVWAGLTSRSLLKVELKRNQITEDRAEREQASHVAAWTAFCPDVDDGGAKDGVFIKNSSTAAVYDVVVESNGRDGAAQPALKMTILPPGEYFVRADRQYHWAFPVSPAELGTPIRPITKHLGWQVQALTFTDAQGTGWQRRGAQLVKQ